MGDILNKLSNYKDSFILFACQSLENYSNEELDAEMSKRFQYIDNILSSLDGEDYVRVYSDIIMEIKYEYRRKLIELCQSMAAAISRCGVENINLFDGCDYRPIVALNYMIDLLDYKLDSLTGESIIEDDGSKKVYFFTEGAIKDLDSLSPAFYKDVKEAVRKMYSGDYDGKQNRCKVLRDDVLDNSYEHRGNNGIRVYENRLKTGNLRVAKQIETFEKTIGATVHFVYKIECKKCTSANGLDDSRRKRYRNDKDLMTQIIQGLKKKPLLFLDDAEESKKALDEVLKKGIKDTSEEESTKEIGLYTINEFLHEDFDPKIFDGEVDSNISAVEISEENADEYDAYKVFRRLMLYLNTLELKQLQHLSVIFSDLNSSFDENDLDSDLPASTKEMLKNKEKSRIYSYLFSLFKQMSLNELLETEKDILMLMDFEEEYMTYVSIHNRIEEEKQYEK